MCPRPHLWFWALITACLAQEHKAYIGSRPHLWFCACKTAPLGLKFLWVLDPTCGFCMQNSDFWTRITSLYVSQTWSVIVCMYKSVLSIRITSLYGSQPSFVGFACKTATFAPEWQVSMGSSPHLCFFSSCKTVTLRPDLQVCISPSPQLWIWTHITACLAQE